MLHSLDFNIREQLADYLAGKISLREFEDWFFPETWDIDQTDNVALANVVYGITFRLAEFSNGDWTETELHSTLRSILERHVLVVPQSQIQYGTSITSYRARVSVTSNSGGADTPPRL